MFCFVFRNGVCHHCFNQSLKRKTIWKETEQASNSLSACSVIFRNISSFEIENSERQASVTAIGNGLSRIALLC